MRKADAYCQMADHATQALTAQVRDWVKFLVAAGRLYEYSFPDQVMVYTQRPGAVACAEFDEWNRLGRHVRRGAKGIALLRYREGRAFLQYVFDIADTERRDDGDDPLPWQYHDKYQPAVTARLAECFGIPGDEGLDHQLIQLAVKFVDDYWRDSKDRILESIRGSLLDGSDEDDAACRFCEAVTVSLAFLLMDRCGFDMDRYFTPGNFNCIEGLNTRDAVLALGNAVSESTGVILRQVEDAVKQHIRSSQN